MVWVKGEVKEVVWQCVSSEGELEEEKQGRGKVRGR